MDNKSKKMKIYGSLLGVAVDVLALDQIFPAEPTPSATENPYAVTPSSNANTPTIPVTFSNTNITSLENRFATKLQTKAEQLEFNPQHIQNALIVPESWGLHKKPKQVNNNNTEVVEVDHVAKFQEQYELTGVLSQQGQGIAVINGNQFLVVGKKLDGFELVAVTEGKAVFLRGKLLAELKVKQINPNN